jgi:hypothetical protein
VRDNKKKPWASPTVVNFDSPEELWNHYKDRATPVELARLALLIEHWKMIRSRRAALNRRSA